MVTQEFHPSKVHMVGSIPLPTATDTFEHLISSLPHLTRLPDGEPGSRGNFVVFQGTIFAPHIIHPRFRTDPDAPDDSSTTSTSVLLQSTSYDEHAILSYHEFCRLRNKGVIPAGVRFQVCLPTPLNVVAFFVLPEYQVEAEKLYELALLKSLRNIQENIPKEDLAIQWDLPLDLAYMEYAKLLESTDGELGEWLVEPYQTMVAKPWFDNVGQGVLERAERLMGAVNEGVEMGLHLCYGDLGRKHYMEPKDTSTMVEFVNALYDGLRRKIDWVHMPVPIGRLDEEFYGPLKGLKMGNETQLFLGLVHSDDEEGTRKRIKAAHKSVKIFGVSTECGCGRRSKEELASILKISKNVTSRIG